MSYKGKNPFKILRHVQYVGGITTRTLSGNVTLTMADSNIQRIDPGGAGRTITLPAEDGSNEGAWFEIINEADAAEDLTVQDPGTNLVATVSQNEKCTIVMDDAGNWVHTGIISISIGTT